MAKRNGCKAADVPNQTQVLPATKGVTAASAASPPLLPEALSAGPYQLASGCGRGFDPSLKRDRRNGAGSTIGGAPVTMSATSLPAPGPIPKPCPENPVAMKKPGILSTAEMTGIASGITSIMPPQLCATATFLKAGKLSAMLARARSSTNGSASGSSTRTLSKGDA